MPDPRSIIPLSTPPEGLITYVNKYIDPNIDTINVYLDFKNAATALFIPEVVSEITTNARNNYSKIDNTIFQSIIYSISSWKYWCSVRSLMCNFFICTDSGKSKYHRELNSDYKANRKINDLMLPFKEDMERISKKNIELAENLCNNLNGVYFFNLDFLESDFLSYYLITRKYKGQQNILHVILSNDKDHYQTLIIPRTLMIGKKRGEIKFFEKGNILNEFFGINSEENEEIKAKLVSKILKIDPEYICILLSINGDISDNIKGVSGVGPKRLLNLFDDLNLINEFIGSPEEILNRIKNESSIIKESALSFNKLSPHWQKIIREKDNLINSYKQISYECLCNWLEKNDTINKLKHQKYIDTILNKKEEFLIKKENIPELIQLFKKLDDMILSESCISMII